MNDYSGRVLAAATAPSYSRRTLERGTQAALEVINDRLREHYKNQQFKTFFSKFVEANPKAAGAIMALMEEVGGPGPQTPKPTFKARGHEFNS